MLCCNKVAATTVQSKRNAVGAVVASAETTTVSSQLTSSLQLHHILNSNTVHMAGKCVLC